MIPGVELLVAYAISAFLSAASAVVLFQRRRESPGAAAFTNVLVLETIWTLAGMCELTSKTLSAKIFWDDVQLAPSLFMAVEGLTFALTYVGRAPRSAARFRLLFGLVPTLTTLYVISDPLHGTARATARIVPALPYGALTYEFSAIETFAFVYEYVLIFAAGGLLFVRLLGEHRMFRLQSAVAFVALQLPTAASFLTFGGVSLFGHRDFSPLMFGVSGVLVVWALGRRRFLDIVPIGLDAVVDSVVDAVVLVDARRRVVDANPAASALFGRPVDRLLGRDLGRVSAVLDTFLARVDLRKSGNREVTLGTPLGERTFEAMISGISDAPGSNLGTAIILHDVTESRQARDALRRAHDELESRVASRTKELSEANEALSEANLALVTEMSERLRAERERAELELQLQAAQKMESMGRLAGGIAHDFNNLLTAILCNAELLSRKLAHEPRLLELLEPVRRAGESATGLTRQLLAFSRHQIVEPKVLDVDASIERVRAMLERIIGEDVRLEFVPRSRGASFRCDAGQFEQVILNLAVNARDAMGMGGAITIGTARTRVGESRRCSDGTVLSVGDYITVSVADTGTGIPPEVLAKVFEPFFTTKAEGRGTGLGLAVVRDVVRQHGGAIDVESKVGTGTTFRVHFPRIEAEASSIVEDARIAEPPGGTERVLVVEDQLLVRDAIAKTLERLGYGVVACDSANGGLSVMKRPVADIDLLVTDVVLADGSGRALAESARSHSPRLAVLFVSGYTDDVILRHGIAHGDLRYLAKPFTERQLAVAVRRALDERSLS